MDIKLIQITYSGYIVIIKKYRVDTDESAAIGIQNESAAIGIQNA